MNVFGSQILTLESITKQLEAIYDQVFPALFLQGKIMGASDQMVRDTIHDIFLELLEKKERLLEINNYKSYLSVSFRRRLSKSLKKQFTDYDESKGINEKSYETFIIENENKVNLSYQLKKAIQALSPAQKQIIKLKFFSGLTYEEIASDQDKSLRTIYNQFHSAIKMLRNNKNLK